MRHIGRKEIPVYVKKLHSYSYFAWSYLPSCHQVAQPGIQHILIFNPLQCILNSEKCYSKKHILGHRYKPLTCSTL